MTQRSDRSPLPQEADANAKELCSFSVHVLCAFQYTYLTILCAISSVYAFFLQHNMCCVLCLNKHLRKSCMDLNQHMFCFVLVNEAPLLFCLKLLGIKISICSNVKSYIKCLDACQQKSEKYTQFSSYILFEFNLKVFATVQSLVYNRFF